MKKKLLATAAILTTLGGYTVFANSNDTPTPVKSETVQVGLQNDYLSKNEVKALVVKDADVSLDQAKFEEVEFDTDDGVSHYEVDFHVDGREYEYDIHAESGKILEQNFDYDDAGDKKGRLTAQKSQLSLGQAKQIAFERAGVDASEIYVEEAELDEDDGRLVFELEFKAASMEYEAEIDAYTGDILDFEQEHDD